MFDFSSILKWLKPSPKYFFAIAIGSGFLLFMPLPLLREFQLGFFTVIYRDSISIIFIFSCAIIISYLMFWGAKSGNEAAKKISFRWQSIRALKNLSSEEKELLSNYILNETKSWNILRQDGISVTLEKAGIIYRASNIGDGLDRFPFNLQPWMWIKLRKHLELLEPELSLKRKQNESRHRR